MMTVKEILNDMDYGPSPEGREHVDSWLTRNSSGFTHFINGQFVDTGERTFFDVSNPADDSVLARVAQGTATDVAAAVDAARDAFTSWSALPGHARARYLYAIARHVQKRERFLSVLESLDNGKPLRESRDVDVPLVARHFTHHAGWAELVASEFPGYGPIGVCAQIIPWNFPLLMLAWKIAPALAAGNTVVLKPAEYTPLTALAFAEICREVGLPPGVINIVCGDGETGAALVAHSGVAKIAFTGSTEVGRTIREATAGSGKQLSLELGGKSPFVVFDDADLDGAVEGVVDAIWFNQGEMCCAGSRLLVQEGIAERFHAKLRRRMETLRVGDPLDKSTDVGAIVAPVQLARIQELVDRGVQEGGTVWRSPGTLPESGNYYPPTLITDVDPASTLAAVEIFGPVAVSMSFRTLDEAIALANNTQYGLAASIWSENINVALDAAAKIKAGVVWINSTNLFDAAAGFGGYKASGFGREGGREGMYDYLMPESERRTTPETYANGFVASPLPTSPDLANRDGLPDVDRTAKLYIGGKQVRPDSGHSFTMFDRAGSRLGEAGLGSRKDIRNAVEAAAKAGSWSTATGHSRAQVLYYIAENFSSRAEEMAERLCAAGAPSMDAATREVEAAIGRIFWYAAWADKYDGRVHSTKSRHITLAVSEAWGAMGVVAPDEAPLLSLVSLVTPAIALGNRVVVVPSERSPLVATDLYQVLETSDVPAGVINIVTGERDVLANVLAQHDGVAALWYFGSKLGSASVEKLSAGNVKSTWVSHGRTRNWHSSEEGQGHEYLRHATQIKNIWIPFGD